MIHVARLDGSDLIVNADLIETIEETPDTVISLVNGKKYIVREHAAEVVRRIIAYRWRINGLLYQAIGPSYGDPLRGGPW